MGQIRFEIWKSAEDNQWYWHAGSEGNGKILARSTDGYVNRADCLHSIALMRAHAASARIFDRDAEHFINQ